MNGNYCILIYHPQIILKIKWGITEISRIFGIKSWRLCSMIQWRERCSWWKSEKKASDYWLTKAFCFIWLTIYTKGMFLFLYEAFQELVIIIRSSFYILLIKLLSDHDCLYSEEKFTLMWTLRPTRGGDNEAKLLVRALSIFPQFRDGWKCEKESYIQ